MALRLSCPVLHYIYRRRKDVGVWGWKHDCGISRVRLVEKLGEAVITTTEFSFLGTKRHKKYLC